MDVRGRRLFIFWLIVLYSYSYDISLHVFSSKS